MALRTYCASSYAFSQVGHSRYTSDTMQNNALITGIIGALLGGGLVLAGMCLAIPEEEKTFAEIQNELIAQYYASEAATLVSPHSIRERMDRGDDSFILVDTRAKVDYEREHIIGAINIDSSESFGDVLDAYEALDQDKQIIIYCYSASCMNGRKVGNFLAENGIYVQEMTVGWNEWRYDWTGWNYDTEWDRVFVEDYVISGSEPGTPRVLEKDEQHECGVAGALGC